MTHRGPRALVLGAVAVLVSCLLTGAFATYAGAAPVSPATPAPVSFTDDFYFPLAHPVRVGDTRTGVDGPIVGGVARNFSLTPMYAAGRPGTSPESAGVVVLNITVVDPSTAGYLIATVGNTGGYEQPDYAHLHQSNLNWAPGQTVANQVFVPTASAGSIAVWISQGTADVIVDASGFFPFDSGSGTLGTRSHYLPLSGPDRIYDSRTADGRFAPGEVRVLDLGLPTTAVGREKVTAAAVTLTVTGPTGPGALTAWDGLGAPPEVSSLNFSTGGTVANSAVVPVACVAAGSDPCADLSLGLALTPGVAADVVLDVMGYYRLDPGANYLGYYPTTPLRIGDSRTATANPPRLGAGKTAFVDVSAYDAVSGGAPAQAVHLTLTAVAPTAPTFLTAYAVGTRPPTSSSDPFPGGDTAVAVQPRVVNDTFRLYNNAGRVDVVLDLDGVFRPEGNAQDTARVGREGARFTHTNTRVGRSYLR